MDSDITVCDRSCSVLLCGVKRFDPMKFYWNDVELTEEEYNQKWKEWLEYESTIINNYGKSERIHG